MMSRNMDSFSFMRQGGVPRWSEALRSKARFLRLQRILILGAILIAVPLRSSERLPTLLDPEHVVERLKQDVSLTEEQSDAIRPMVDELCRSFESLHSQVENGEEPVAADAGTDADAYIIAFEEAVSPHLSRRQSASMKGLLESWKLEFFRGGAGKPSSAEIVTEPSGTRMGLSVAAPGFGDSPGSVTTDLGRLESAPESGGGKTDAGPAKGEWAIAPFPLVNPTIGNGFVLITAYIRPLSAKDKVSPPSIFGAGGMVTSSSSWAVGYGQKLFLMRDRFRIAGAFGVAQLNYDFSVSGDGQELSYDVPIHQKGYGFMAGGQVRTWERWYLGMQYHFIKANTGVDLNEILPDLPVDLEPLTLDIVVAGFKAQIERDSRDSQFYPGEGSVFSVDADFNEEAFGGDFNFQKYAISYKAYHRFGERQTLAYTISGCDVEGKVPFFSQCMLGSSEDLRGYATGKNQDRRMIVGQAEYRLQLPWRFGAVGFMGAGEVADEWSHFTTEDILPGGGLGLRFLLAKSNRLNMRFDYAWGKDSSAWYISLGEAF